MSAATDAILQRLTALHPKVIDLSLDRIRQLLSDLGDPQDRIPPVIHVAGTNGKGSTQAFIRAGLEAAGLRVHAYTSPHLAFFNERIRLAGELIGDEMLADTLAEVERVNADRPITFFEVTTAAGFLAFSRVAADYTLLEVGLGGRLDATNVVKAPRLTVITPVSVDHTQYLGETLTQIAGEKAGILKRRVPCIVARQPDEALAVIEAAAARLGCPLSVAGQYWTVAREGDALVYQDERGLADVPLPALPGPHQVGNAGTAIAALRELGLGRVEVAAAMKEVEWPARMQRLTRGPLVRAAGSCEIWLDGGHNPAGGEAVAATLAAMPRKPVHLVCGMLNTKDVAGYMRPLAPQIESLTAVSIEGEPATLPARTTADMAESLGIPAATAPDVSAAVAAIARQHPGARILICGSLYLAGRVLRENG